MVNSINAAPMLVPLGTQDLSLVKQAPIPVAIPQHCPKQFFYAQKGPTNPQLTVGAGMVQMYGADTFDLRKKFANHATVFANMFNANGNAMMTQRILPTDASTANMMLVLDVLQDTQQQYARNADGSLQYDISGNPVLLTVGVGITTVPVITYQFVWIDTSKITMATHPWVFGQGFSNGSSYTISSSPADYGLPVRTASVGGGTNKIYPIFEFKAGSAGSWGSNAGISIWAPTGVNNTQFPTTMLNQAHAYPLTVQMVTRPDINSSAVITPTIMGSQSVAVTLMPGTIDPTTDGKMYVGDTLISQYQNLTDARFPNVYADLGNMVIYQNNIDKILNLVTDAEAYANSVSITGGNETNIAYDGSFATTVTTNTTTGVTTSLLHPGVTVDYSQKYAINLFGGVTSNNVPYETWREVSTPHTAPMNQYTPAWAFNGSDGTMNDLLFDHLVGNEMLKYLDPNDPLQELAVNVESVIYDSGFTLPTKMKLLNFIAVRRDTAVVLSTHQCTISDGTTVNNGGLGNAIVGPVLTADQEASLAITLRTAAQLFPESDYFGTPCMRAMIFGRCGTILNSQYTGKMPLTYDVANKYSQYMGAGNGKWTSTAAIDNAITGGSNVVTTMSDLSITWVPNTARSINWSIGLNWVQAFDTRSFFFPAFKTVYSGNNSDSSVLNSMTTVMAICQLNKIAAAAWRNFTNSNSYSPAQLIANVNKFVNDQVSGIFDNRFVIVPDCQITSVDAAKGYEFTLPIKIYANSMISVMITYIQAYRLSSYTPVA